MDVDTAVRRNISQMPLKMAVAHTAARIEGVFVEVDSESGKALHIERFSELSVL
jgi:calcineurin-like phosphoesterase